MALVQEVLEDYQSSPDGSSRTLDWLWQLDYREKPVSIDEFIESDRFMGEVLSTTSDGPRGDSVYPAWREDLREVFRPGANYTEWIFGGAIGTGKTSSAILAMAYNVYRMSLLRNPQQYYNLMSTSRIVHGIYSVTKAQVYDVGYLKLRSMLEACPYFVNEFQKDPRIETRCVFPQNNMVVMAGSRAFHALGLDVFQFLLDELNFMATPGNRKKDIAEAMGQAYELYNACRTRLKSRYMRPGGDVAGMMFLVSSKQTRTSFLEKHLSNSKAEIDAGETFVSEYSLWEVKDKRLFTMPKFKVEIGDRIYPSRILESDDAPRDGAEIISVPGEYHREFDHDVDQALRDIAGIATYGVSPLIRNRKVIYDCISKKREHPFTQESVTITDLNDISIDEFFLPEKLFSVRRSTYVPKRHPYAPRFVHYDTSRTQDCSGLAIVHVAGMKEVTRNREGTVYTDAYPVIEVDLMLQIKPPVHGEIDFSKVRAFLLSLRDYGLPILKITCDEYQSTDFLQVMRKNGFEAQVCSVDKNDGSYLVLRQCMLEQRLRFYHYAPFIREVSDLERDVDRRKVDHPKTGADGFPGSKDVSDAVAASVDQAMGDPRAMTNMGPSLFPDLRKDVGTPSHKKINWSKLEREV